MAHKSPRVPARRLSEASPAGTLSLIRPRTVRMARRELRSGTSVLAICIVIVTLLVLPATVAADNFVGGLPLTTVRTETVTGDLWFDAAPAPNWGSYDVTKTFTLPAAAVAEPGRITWARLYVSGYVGHMTNDYPISFTNSWDGDGVSGYEQVWSEPDHAPFAFVGQGGCNDNSALGGGSCDPYKMLNDHETRVTSDYFMWYDVTDLVKNQTIFVNVNTVTPGQTDGRIKVITLVVAYNDPASTTQTQYWVNEGHDACSYYTENNFGEVAVGSTTFGTSGVTGISSATLTVDYMASHNGLYGFPSKTNIQDAGVPSITFTNQPLASGYDVQGPYSGLMHWDVTSLVTGSGNAKLGYSRDVSQSGLSAFYKIPLAFLVVKKPIPVNPPVAAFSAAPVSGPAPLTVLFTDESTNSPTSRVWDFGDGNTSWSTAETTFAHTYESTGTYDVTLAVSNAGGSDDEIKEDFITVASAPPVADFTAMPLTGSRPLTVLFTDVSTNDPTDRVWDFGDGNSSWSTEETTFAHTYESAGTYDVALAVSNAVGSDSEAKDDFITVTPQCDLTITGTVLMNPPGTIFANLPNTVKINTIKNNGPDTITNIPVALYASDVSGGTVPVATTTIASLASGASVAATYLPDSTIRPSAMLGQTVTYTAVVDPGNVIAETNEANNNKASVATTIKYNGYTGKRYTDGSDMNTATTFDGKYGLVYSHGDSVASGTAGTRTVTFTSTDLPIPSGATVIAARLYQPYRYVTSGVASWTMVFNGNDITGTQAAVYNDNPSYTMAYDEGLYAYDVTSSFNTAGNTLVLTQPASNEGLAGVYMVVVYSDPSTTEKTIWINEEYDHLKSFTQNGSSSTVTSDQATAWANFAGADTSRLASAKVIAICPFTPSGSSATFFFNSQQYATLLSSGYLSDPNIAVTEYDVTSALASGANTARFQSTLSGSSGADFYAANAILVMEKTAAAPVAAFSADPVSGTVPLTVLFTDSSTGSPTTRVWDFGDGNSTWTTTETTFAHTYAAAGTYDVTLAVSNDGGSDSRTRDDYIAVTNGMVTIPGQANPPTDPDSDGKYEDLNGSTGTDFPDVQLYFQYMDWIRENEPVIPFDYSDSGTIDFPDIQLLFGEV